MPDSHYLIQFIALLPAAYLLGSVPWGLVLAQIFASVDLRKIGSGNIGATNARRAGGWRLGIATLLADSLKGTIPVCAALIIFSHNSFFGQAAIALTALAAFFGHLFPIYLKFKTGGKGVATAAGCFVVLSPIALLAALGVFAAVTAITRRVSAASISAAVTLPLAVFGFGYPGMTTACALIVAVSIIIRHRENLRRLLSGTEPGL